ncbi:MAG: enoyl-CoA hydratase-related protein [Bdellovibrionota bacterium]
MSTDVKTIQMQNHGGVWTLTINRPEALNALNSAVLNEMADSLRMIGEMTFEHARAMIITGAGEKAFVAGADIKEMLDLEREQAQAFAEKGQSVLAEISRLKIPVVAAVNGFALGGGFELALACDFIYASENAKFGLPEVTLGLIPGFGGTARLSRAAGQRRAQELTLSGEVFNAQDALNWGIVNKVVPQSELLTETRKKIDVIISRAPYALEFAKEAVEAHWNMPMEDALSREAQRFSQLFEFEDTREGMKAFTEKRKANFQGK